MICPRCNTPNDPGFQFCMNCGQPLSAFAHVSQAVPTRSLWIETARVVIMIFALWIARVALVGQSFTRELAIPNFPLPVTTILSVFVYLAIIILLISYAAAFPRLWRAAFPAYGPAAQIITALIYLLLLGQIYRAAQPLLVSLIPEPEALVLVQVLLLIIAFILILRALLTLNRQLPAWLSRLSSVPEPIETPAAQSAPAQAAQAVSG